MNEFRIVKIPFAVHKAEFMGYLLTPTLLVWSVSVAAVPQSVSSSNSSELWYPCAQIQELPNLTNRVIASWTELFPIETIWTEGSSNEDNAFSVFGSSYSILETRLSISFVENDTLHIGWTGRTDVALGEKFDDVVPFEISTEGHFAGIRSFCPKEKQARKYLEKFLQCANLEFLTRARKHFFVPSKTSIPKSRSGR